MYVETNIRIEKGILVQIGIVTCEIRNSFNSKINAPHINNTNIRLLSPATDIEIFTLSVLSSLRRFNNFISKYAHTIKTTRMIESAMKRSNILLSLSHKYFIAYDS
jgi:predicted xylose isomerase-like sugar epimerase